jgi:uroporphyrinogen-III synthase
LKKLPIFVPGEGTSGNLEKIGYNNIIGKDTGNADNLFIEIKDYYTKNNTSKKLLFLVGDKTRPTLPNKMNELSIPYDKFQVYETYKDSEFDSSISKLNLAEIDWVAFFSPSGMDFSFDILQSWLAENRVKIAAIGETTKLHLENLNFRVSACPLKPNAKDLAHAIVAENLI